jgi:putative hydrolase of the HAD superfamily
MKKLKAVFFDAAGTLFEPREPVGNSYATIARDYGVEVSGAEINAAFRRVFRNAPPLAFGSGRNAVELRRLERLWWHDLVATTFEGLGQFTDFEAYFGRLFDFFADPANWVADGDAIRTTGVLRQQGFILGVISNFDFRIYRILEGLRLRDCFDSITISSEVGFAKPSANLFRAALENHRLSPDEALHVGDSEHLDLAGASAAGLGALLLDPATPDRRLALTEPALNNRLERVPRSGRVPSLGSVVEAVRFFGEGRRL